MRRISHTAAVLITVLTATAQFFYYGEAFGIASTVAIAVPATGHSSTAIVCGVLAKELPRTIRCSVVTATGAEEPFDILPNVTFASVSSSKDIVCGLLADRTTFYCWKVAFEYSNGEATPAGLIMERVHADGDFAVQDLSIGVGEIAVSDKNGTFVRLSRDGSTMPTSYPGYYNYLGSGLDYMCAIRDRANVECWGSGAENIFPAFDGKAMKTIFSGESHACGTDLEGNLICGGNDDYGQSSLPRSSYPNEFGSIALGSTHTCAVRRRDLVVVCWGAGMDTYEPVPVTTCVEFVVASGNLTCGLLTGDLSVGCWWANRRHPGIINLPFRRDVLPWFCQTEQTCPCSDVVGYSSMFCSDSDIICKPCY